MVNNNIIRTFLLIVWIVSWFAAIWIDSYREQLFITGLLAFALSIAIICYDIKHDEA